jgi:uroporphyrinogen-III synthase
MRKDLQARNLHLSVSPLIEPEFVTQPPDLRGIKGVVFTARTAVEAFAALCPAARLPAYAVGDATADAARHAGLCVVSAGGDADALVRRILADGVQGPLLHLRGEHARGSVAQRLSGAGCPTREAVLYHQKAQPFTPEARALLDGHEPVLVPLFSPRTATIFSRQHRGQAPLFIAAMSPQVAEAVMVPCWRLVVAEHPSMTAMVSALDELLDAARDLEDRRSAQ